MEERKALQSEGIAQTKVSGHERGLASSGGCRQTKLVSSPFAVPAAVPPVTLVPAASRENSLAAARKHPQELPLQVWCLASSPILKMWGALWEPAPLLYPTGASPRGPAQGK